jgi:predicted metal-dependent hydrolase
MTEKITSIEGIGDVRLIRKARARQLRISVRAYGEVLVSIPWLYSFSRGEAFLEEKKEWVKKTKEKLEKRGIRKMTLEPGTLFSTRHYKYQVLPLRTDRVKACVRTEEKTVIIGYPENVSLLHPETREKIRMNLEGVLRYEAKRYLPGRTKALAEELGYSYKAVTIKNNRTNWGSCSGLKNINLNLHLMRLPDRLIDYIVVHELVHTQIPNHGPLFRQRLKTHFPDSEILDKEIKKFRPELF